MPHPDLPAVEHCNCISLRRASRRLSLYYDACLAPAGLRATQFSMLAILAQRGPLRVNALASLLDMDRSTAGQNVKLLERDGLMALLRSPTDGRSREVQLTAAGRAKLAAALPLWNEAQHSFEALNGEADAASLRASLQGLRIPDPVTTPPSDHP